MKATTCLVLLTSWVLSTTALSNEALSNGLNSLPNPDLCNPLVIAHRGASGYIPEHTLGAYSLAIIMGADYIEPDLVMTQDGHMIARHDNDLGLTTDIRKHPEFANRSRTQTVDGSNVSGWFTEDFTLAEIKTLRAIERIPDLRPGNARLDGAFDVPTLQEIIDLAKSLQQSQRRKIGIYLEIKHSSHFKQLGLAMERPLLNLLHRNGYRGASDPIYIQSFEVNNLKELKNLTELKLLQLFKSNNTFRPYDQILQGTSLTYSDMATPAGLREVATYAYAVGPDKNYIISPDENDNPGQPTSFVQNAHAVGLKVHPYAFRAENSFLPSKYKSADSRASSIGNLKGELRAYLATGIDGLFTDQPDVLVSLRKSCTNKMFGI